MSGNKTPDDGLTPGTIREGEYHPAAESALAYVKARMLTDPMMVEAIYSTALSENRTAEIVAETLTRIREGQPVTDRYVLGAAWFIRELEEAEQ